MVPCAARQPYESTEVKAVHPNAGGRVLRRSGSICRLTGQQAVGRYVVTGGKQPPVPAPEEIAMPALI
jgi:uncharacterized protein (DUF1330 family)